MRCWRMSLSIKREKLTTTTAPRQKIPECLTRSITLTISSNRSPRVGMPVKWYSSLPMPSACYLQCRNSTAHRQNIISYRVSPRSWQVPKGVLPNQLLPSRPVSGPRSCHCTQPATLRYWPNVWKQPDRWRTLLTLAGMEPVSASPSKRPAPSFVVF